jgi:hypothetical protein
MVTYNKFKFFPTQSKIFYKRVPDIFILKTGFPKDNINIGFVKTNYYCSLSKQTLQSIIETTSHSELTRRDEDITPSDTHKTPLDIQGPITRARVRQLNLEVSSFLSTSLYVFENRLLPNDYIMIRNHGEHQEILGEELGGGKDQQGRPSQGGGPNRVDFEFVSESRSSLH